MNPVLEEFAAAVTLINTTFENSFIPDGVALS
jgi:hypothetical protein